ncbi:MAG: LytTR family transcriptional regulator DNA-binding domain-containing protein [Bacteroidales bacterium]|nr:LytTR family transcriptional regulator DNA-binding domain-containing protein [Bacteroidales bacterium]
MSEKIRLLIVEDEITLAEDIALRLTEAGYLIAGIAANVDEALVILQNKRVDVAILDIFLHGELDGIDLAEIINERFNIPFLFLSSYANKPLVERAKKVKPYAYMLKPFNDRQVQVAIEMALINFSNSAPAEDISTSCAFSEDDNQVLQLKDSLFLKKRDSYFERVDLKDIMWLEACSNYTCIYTNSDKFMYSIVLKKIEQKLPENQFMRVHRSYVVNIENITGFIGNTLCINDKQIPVSKVHRDEVFKKFTVI